MGFDFFSPGCNCKAIFTNTGPCSGVITWCTKPGATVIVQKKTGGTWNDVAVVLPTDPQAYPVNNSQTGTYRIKCVLCNNQASTSAEITTQFCGTHSWWFRLARMNCTLYDYIKCPNLPAEYRLKTILVSGVPRTVVACYNCLGQEITPVGSDTFYVLLHTQTSGINQKAYSISYTNFKTTRVGYTFDYRFLGISQFPSCGGGPSWAYFFQTPQGFGSFPLGPVVYTNQANLSWKLIGEKTTSDTYWNDPTTPESGSYSETLNHGADITVWYNPYGVGNASVGYTGLGVAWNDGTFMGSYDPMGNSLGIIYDDRFVNKVISGTKPPTYPSDWSMFGPETMYWPARRYNSEPATEQKVRTCNEYNNGTNPLPPGSVMDCFKDAAPGGNHITGCWLP